jgi:hypothetical protein
MPTFWTADGQGKTLKSHQKSAKNRRVLGIKSGLDTCFAHFCSYIQLCQVDKSHIYLKQLENMCSFLFLLSSPVKCQKIVVVVLISFDRLSQPSDWTRFANFKANGPFIPRFM